ncbi:unnamed protein product, partial [Rodentolepis nana]|uniref:TPR_REGION domain-containing protein n=1 Tax=Rodentolepis nana TaxID=102285 RepID=A0A158QJ25_RODNA
FREDWEHFYFKLWKTVSRNRDIKSSSLRGVTDGCKCWITLISSGNSPLILSENTELEPEKSLKVCFRVGQSPEQSLRLRGVIEKNLISLGLGSSTVIEVTPDGQSPANITINLDGFSAPQTFNPTPVNDEEEEKNQPTLEDKKEEAAKDNEENAPNLAWRASYSRLWFARSDALKNRGSLHFKASRIAEAFSCYSRALQLITLLGASFGLAERAQQEDSTKYPCEEYFGIVNAEEYLDLDAESPFTVDPDQIELNGALIEKMHFSLLSNMALCQLKVCCPSSAAKLCSKALQMAPKNERLLSQVSKELIEAKICVKDVVKVLYRRATAYLQLDEYEAGIRDTERLLQLDPSNDAGNKLARQLTLALRSHNADLGQKMKRAFQ